MNLQDQIAVILSVAMPKTTMGECVQAAEILVEKLSLRREWATEESLMLGIVKLTRPDDAIACRIGSPWEDLSEPTGFCGKHAKQEPCSACEREAKRNLNHAF